MDRIEKDEDREADFLLAGEVNTSLKKRNPREKRWVKSE